MKTIGQKVQEFRSGKGWNTTRMAKEVGTSRQNIENLEAKEVGQPRYIKKLAMVMNVSVDDLLGQTISPPRVDNQNHFFAPTITDKPPMSLQDGLRVVAMALELADISDRNAAKAYLVELCDKPGEVDTFAAKLVRLLTPLPAQANGTRT
jgi:transcriptional regulator with XRE-family HTH domain